MAVAPVLVGRPAEGVALVTLNRPEVHNALDTAMGHLLDEHLGTLEDDPSVRCVVFTGAGEAAFSSGYDIGELASMSADEVTLALAAREEWMWHFASLRMPTVAALGGITYGAGALIACALDLRIGCERTTFKFTAGAYGGANATWDLPLLVGMGKAKELLYTSRCVGATEAERIGLLNTTVDAGRVVDEAVALAESIAAHPPEGIAQVKALVQAGPGRGLRERYEAENVVMRTTLKPRPMTEVFSGFLASPEAGTTPDVRR